MPQDGTPSSTSVDVLAAQVRERLTVGEGVAGFTQVSKDKALAEYRQATAALDALVARVTEAEREREQLIEQITSGRAGERELQAEIVSLRAERADARNALELIRDGRCPCGGRFKWANTQCRCEQCGTHQGFENPHARTIAREVLARLDGNQP